jgi:hypothetical protein
LIFGGIFNIFRKTFKRFLDSKISKRWLPIVSSSPGTFLGLKELEEGRREGEGGRRDGYESPGKLGARSGSREEGGGRREEGGEEEGGGRREEGGGRREEEKRTRRCHIEQV